MGQHRANLPSRNSCALAVFRIVRSNHSLGARAGSPAAYVPGASSLGPSPVATVLAESRRLLTLTLTLKKTSRHVFLNTVPERAENSLFGSGIAFFKFHNLA